MNNDPIKKLQLNFDEQFTNSKFKKVHNKNSFKDVAQEFESLFVFQMLKSARKAKLGRNFRWSSS